MCGCSVFSFSSLFSPYLTSNVTWTCNLVVVGHTTTFWLSHGLFMHPWYLLHTLRCVHVQVSRLQPNPSCFLPVHWWFPEAVIRICWHRWMSRNYSEHTLHPYLSVLSRWWKGWWNVRSWRRKVAWSFVVAFLTCVPYFPSQKCWRRKVAVCFRCVMLGRSTSKTFNFVECSLVCNASILIWCRLHSGVIP